MDGFAWPLAFALLPLPLLARWLLPARSVATGAVVVPESLAGRLTDGEAAAARAGRLRLALAALVWGLTVLAIAGPQRLLPASALPASAREIVLVIDLSGSMEQRDFMLDGKPARRIDAVKAVARSFVARRAGDRVGLVLFADEAEVAAVPTFDLAAVDDALDGATIGILGRSTAIGDGLGLAVKRLKDSPSPSRVVILLSDGTATAGAVGPRAAAELARSVGVKVHTIALGTDEELAGSSGAASLVDTATLKAIAEIGGGQAFRVRSTEDLVAVTQAIDGLEAGNTEAPPVAVAEPLWTWPAGAALLAMLALLAAERRRP